MGGPAGGEDILGAEGGGGVTCETKEGAAGELDGGKGGRLVNGARVVAGGNWEGVPRWNAEGGETGGTLGGTEGLWTGTGLDPCRDMGLDTPERQRHPSDIHCQSFQPTHNTQTLEFDSSEVRRTNRDTRRGHRKHTRVCCTWSCGGCGRRGAHRWRDLNPAFFHHLLRFKDTLAAIQAGTLKTTRSYSRSPNGGQSHDCRNKFTFSTTDGSDGAVAASEHQLPTGNKNLQFNSALFLNLMVYILYVHMYAGIYICVPMHTCFTTIHCADCICCI